MAGEQNYLEYRELFWTAHQKTQQDLEQQTEMLIWMASTWGMIKQTETPWPEEEVIFFFGAIGLSSASTEEGMGRICFVFCDSMLFKVIKWTRRNQTFAVDAKSLCGFRGWLDKFV